jgi:hypothetical protein
MEHACLKLKFPAQDVHQKLHHCIHWCECVRKEDETYDDRKLLVEAESVVKRSIVDEYREQCEDIEHMELGLVSVLNHDSVINNRPARCRTAWLCGSNSSDPAHGQEQLLPLGSHFSRSVCHR